MAKPLAPQNVGKGQVKAEHVEPWWIGEARISLNTPHRDQPRTTVTAIANQHVLALVLLQTDLAVQLIGTYIRIGGHTMSPGTYL